MAGRVEEAGARNIPPLLELLVNLSCADPRAVAAWLTHGVHDWSPGSVLAGLEAELNNRDEKVPTRDASALCFPGIIPWCLVTNAVRCEGRSCLLTWTQAAPQILQYPFFGVV